MLTNSHQILYRQALRFFLFLHKKKDYDDKDEKDLLSEICGILSFSFVSFYIFWGKNENGHNAKFCEFNKFLNFRWLHLRPYLAYYSYNLLKKKRLGDVNLKAF